MRRKLFLLLILVIPASVQAEDVAKLLAKRYQELNVAVLKRDGKAAEAWVLRYGASDLKYTSKDKRSYDLKRYGLVLKQVGAVQSVQKASIKLGKVMVTGNTAIVPVMSSIEATIGIDKRDLRMSDSSESTETWIKKGTDWKLLRVIQTKADTQLFQK